MTRVNYLGRKTQNFINLKIGREDTNVEGDLKVEHTNCQFKAALMNLCGNYTEDSLHRIAKSLDITSCLQDKLLPQYADRFVCLVIVIVIVLVLKPDDLISTLFMCFYMDWNSWLIAHICVDLSILLGPSKVRAPLG